MNVIHQYINEELIKNKSCMIDRITFDNISHHALLIKLLSGKFSYNKFVCTHLFKEDELIQRFIMPDMYVKSAQICPRVTRG